MSSEAIDYAGRIARVRQAMARHGIALLAIPFSSDSTWLTGLQHERPGPTVTNRPGDTLAGLYLGQRSGPLVVTPRMGGAGVRAAIASTPWIDDLLVLDEPVDRIAALRRIAALCDAPGSLGVTDRSWAANLLALREVLPDLPVAPASELIFHPLRAIKDELELAALRRVAGLTDEVYAEIVPQLLPGVTEREVALEIERLGRQRGAECVSFPTAVLYLGGDSPRGLSHPAYSEPLDLPLERGMGIAFDFGFVLDNYASDFGRTVFAGEPSAPARRVYDLVIGAQAAAIGAMRAGGRTCAAIDRVAREPIERAGHGPDFIHRLGHAIGQDCHEWPSLNVGEESVIQEGMTFTVEPSVYLHRTAYVRIEDVVLVTTNGGESLTRAPRELQVVAE